MRNLLGSMASMALPSSASDFLSSRSSLTGLSRPRRRKSWSLDYDHSTEGNKWIVWRGRYEVGTISRAARNLYLWRAGGKSGRSSSLRKAYVALIVSQPARATLKGAA